MSDLAPGSILVCKSGTVPHHPEHSLTEGALYRINRIYGGSYRFEACGFCGEHDDHPGVSLVGKPDQHVYCYKRFGPWPPAPSDELRKVEVARWFCEGTSA